MPIHIYRATFISLLIFSLVSAVYSTYPRADAYFYLPMLPISFLIVFSAILKATWRSGPSLFLMICSPVAALRYVVFPALVIFNEGYYGRSLIPPSTESYNVAIYLMCYESLVVGALILFKERRYHSRKGLQIFSNPSVLPYWYTSAFIFLGVILALLFPAAFDLINFIRPSAVGDEFSASAFTILIALIFISAKTFLFLRIIVKISESRRFSLLGPWVAAFVGGLNILIYFGTNRLAMVLTAIATVIVIHQFFGRRAKFPIISLVGIAVAIFLIITADREYAKINHEFSEVLADNIQAYTGSLYNVAIGIEVKEYYPEAQSLEILVYDFIRPLVGVNLLVQNWDMLYSNVYFNYRMWVNVDRRSQIMPMLAQGYLFFGPFFAPLLSVFFVIIAYKMLDQIHDVRSLEVRYGLMLVIMRCGFFWGQNNMNIINYMSLYLIIPIAMLAVYRFIYLSLRRKRSF